MTEKLFYRDSHLAEFEAAVVSCRPLEQGEGKKDRVPPHGGSDRKIYEIELDRTAFFPEGGGQYADTGVLGEARVLDVRESDGRIIHYTDAPLETGARVKGCIAWEERFMKMQQHTGEHIVSGLVHRRFGYNNVGFHLGSEDCTMDFNGEITPGELAEIEAEANRAVWKNLKVETVYPAENELAKMEYRSKIEIRGQVRIIVIPGYDRCACCAPHVERTGEIGLIKLTNVQRYKGGARVTMLCGVRALADYAVKQEQAKEVSAMLCAKENETAEAVEHLKKECADLKYALGEKEKKMIACMAEAIPAGDEPVCLFTEDVEGESMRLLMNHVLEAGHSLCAVFHKTGDAQKGSEDKGKDAREAGTYRYVIGSRKQDMRAMAKEFNAAFEGRGGGKQEMVQGTAKGAEEDMKAWILEKAGECDEPNS